MWLPVLLAALSITPLEFREFFEPASAQLKPSAKLVGLSGKRVRISGFMVKMEEPPKGAFYLAPRFVFCDEAGGGTADLPPETVRVIVRSAAGAEVPFVPGPLEVSGILDVGNQTDDAGRVSAVRITLDRPQDLPGRHRSPPHPLGRPTNREQKSSSVRGSP